MVLIYVNQSMDGSMHSLEHGMRDLDEILVSVGGAEDGAPGDRRLSSNFFTTFTKTGSDVVPAIHVGSVKSFANSAWQQLPFAPSPIASARV